LKISSRQFPHPVLSHFSDDYGEHKFHTDIDVKEGSYEYTFDLKFSVTSQDLNRLIHSGQAQFALHVECNATRYRELHTFGTEHHVFSIPVDLLDGKVECTPLVIATVDIPCYSSADFHPDYQGYSFSIAKADVLAVGQGVSFSADKHLDPLKRIPSIFTVKCNSNPDCPEITVNPNADRVVIYVSKKVFEQYSRYRNIEALRPIVSSVIIYPALISIIELMKSQDGHEYEDYRWYRTVMRRVGGQDALENGNAVELASKLIDSPVAKALDALHRFAVSLENDE
jgi:hypothetical protein